MLEDHPKRKITSRDCPICGHPVDPERQDWERWLGGMAHEVCVDEELKSVEEDRYAL